MQFSPTRPKQWNTHMLQAVEYTHGDDDMLRSIILHGISGETDTDVGNRPGTSEAVRQIPQESMPTNRYLSSSLQRAHELERSVEYTLGNDDIPRNIILHGTSGETDTDAGTSVGTSAARNDEIGEGTTATQGSRESASFDLRNIANQGSRYPQYPRYPRYLQYPIVLKRRGFCARCIKCIRDNKCPIFISVLGIIIGIPIIVVPLLLLEGII